MTARLTRSGARRSEAPGRAALLAPELMARVRKIQIRTHRLVSGALQGAYRSNFRGSGLEFEEVRPYQPGDEVRSIDWKVTARTGEPFVKTYIEDRQLVLQLLVDTSRSMQFGSGEKTKNEAAAEVCALLSFVAAAQHDQVGLCLFDEQPGLHLPPSTGHRHILRVVREVVAARSEGAHSSLVSVLEHQLRHLKRRSLVFVVSDFLGLEQEPWSEVLARVGRRHELIAVRVTDPLEERLPDAGLLLVEGLEGGGRVELDTSSRAVREAWHERAQRRRASFREALRAGRADWLEVSTAGDVAEPIVRCFARRARRGGRR